MLSGNLYIVYDNQGIKLADIQIECCSFGLVHSYRQKHFIYIHHLSPLLLNSTHTQKLVKT